MSRSLGYHGCHCIEGITVSVSRYRWYHQCHCIEGITNVIVSRVSRFFVCLFVCLLLLLFWSRYEEYL